MTRLAIPARYRTALLLTTVLSLAACGGGDTTTGASSAPAAATAASTAPASSAPAAPTSAGSAAPAPVVTTAARATGGARDVAGAELVCPAVKDTLALAKDAGWAKGAGSTDPAAKASISAQMVIALVVDDTDRTRALWDAADAIAAAGCPADTAELTGIYGGPTLLAILRAE